MRLPSTVVYLGECLEIKFRDGRFYNPKRAWLCCSVSGKTLWLFPRSKWSPSSRNSKAAKTWEMWSHFGVDKEALISVRENGRSVCLGDVEHIVYSSDKWSKNYRKTDYIHTFSKRMRPKLYSDNPKKPGFCRISGGKIGVRSVGIVG